MSGELADMDGDRAYDLEYRLVRQQFEIEEDFGGLRPGPTTDDRIADLEQAFMDLSELVRHIGQTLSWSVAGQALNDPPLFIRDCQKRLKDLHLKLKPRR